MLYRVIAAAVCSVVLAGCEQAGSALNPIAGPTAPSSFVQPSVHPSLPFSGVVTGEAFFDFATNPKACASGFTTITTATGPASHMGLTTWLSRHCPGPTGELLDAELVLTAANGDELHGTYTGSCGAIPPEIGAPITCSSHMVFLGGTGRFVNASGTAHLDVVVIFEGFGDFSWPGQWEWTGTISY